VCARVEVLVGASKLHHVAARRPFISGNTCACSTYVSTQRQQYPSLLQKQNKGQPNLELSAHSRCRVTSSRVVSGDELATFSN
jgi:hypothetical protein